MFELSHWHPVCRLSDLKSKPIKKKILGTDYVIFKTKSGVGIRESRCPHRRMDLSRGKVLGEKLICPYHSWGFDIHGNIDSPSIGKVECRSQGFETKEKYGLLWFRSPNSTGFFPELELDSYHKIDLSEKEISAPLEIVLDNFSETEHTSTVHAFLGYSEEDLKNVSIEYSGDGTTTHVFNKGRQKKIPFLIRWFLHLDETDEFVDDWTTYFTPVHSVFDQYWVEKETGSKRKDALKIYVFFVPIDESKTRIFVFTYMKYNKLGNLGLNLMVKPAMKFIVRLEVGLDKSIIESIEDKNVSLKGCRLSGFDRVLGMNRTRIQKVYRGLDKNEGNHD